MTISWFLRSYWPHFRGLSCHSNPTSSLLAAVCFWIDSMGRCQGTNDGEYGETWAYRGAVMSYCVVNTLRTDGHELGCAPGTIRHLSAAVLLSFIYLSGLQYDRETLV